MLDKSKLISKRKELSEYPIISAIHPSIFMGDKCYHPVFGDGQVLSVEKHTDRWGIDIKDRVWLHLWFEDAKQYLQTTDEYADKLGLG